MCGSSVARLTLHAILGDDTEAAALLDQALKKTKRQYALALRARWGLGASFFLKPRLSRTSPRAWREQVAAIMSANSSM